MRENRPSGSEGGAGESPFRPLSQVGEARVDAHLAHGDDFPIASKTPPQTADYDPAAGWREGINAEGARAPSAARWDQTGGSDP
jgi:hypothetical protein